jgi:hypothetical protein
LHLKAIHEAQRTESNEFIEPRRDWPAKNGRNQTLWEVVTSKASTSSKALGWVHTS